MDVLKSPTDNREYRYVTLDNGMRITLISDPSSVSSAAAVSVNVGSNHNKRELMGLAHFLEHMLFLGTSTYPDEHTYNRTLAEHGGHSNAFTDCEQTVYYFDVHPEYLAKVLDIFSQFFIAPLFTESATMRELTAVQNEHSKNLESDSWRFDLLKRSRGHSEHPMSWFHTGDLEHLLTQPKAAGIDTRAELIAFHARYYASGIMTAAVLGRESLDGLEAMTRACFAPVARHTTPIPLHPTNHLSTTTQIDTSGLPQSDWRARPYGIDFVGERLTVLPVRETRSVEISFECSAVGAAYDRGTFGFVSNLIGHEGAGSLLSLLKARGWANALSSGESGNYYGFALFGISIDLTVQGLANVDNVVAAVFAYIRLLQQSPPPAYFYDELRGLNELAFRFKGKEQPSSYVTAIVQRMQKVRAADILVAPYLYREMHVDDVNRLLASLAPQRALVLIADPALNVSSAQTEPIYGTRFTVCKHDARVLSLWRGENAGEYCDLFSDLSLPKPNPFVPKKLELIPLDAWDVARRVIQNDKTNETADATVDKTSAESDNNNDDDDTVGGGGDDDGLPPLLLRRSNRLSLWHKQDATFKKPKVNVLCIVDTPVAYESARSQVVTSLFVACVTDQLNEFAYDAELAGLSFQLSVRREGVTVSLHGYNDKMEVLLSAVADALHKPQISSVRFEALKERQRREYANFALQEPHKLVFYEESFYTDDKRYHMQEYLSAIESVSVPITFDDVLMCARRIAIDGRIRAFVHGNASVSTASALLRRLCVTLFGEQQQQQSTVSTTTTTVISSDATVHNVITPTVPPPPQPVLGRAVALETGRTLILQRVTPSGNNKNSAILNRYVVGTLDSAVSVQTAMVVELIGLIVSEMAFNILRTQEQLGYIVGMIAFSDFRSHNFCVYLQARHLSQSDAHDPAHLNARVESFIATLPTILSELTDEQFAKYKGALMQLRSRRDKKMEEETNRLWKYIIEAAFTFDRRAQEIAAVRALTRDMLRPLFEQYVSNPRTRSKFATQMWGGVNATRLRDHQARVGVNVPLLSAAEIETGDASARSVGGDWWAFKAGRALMPRLSGDEGAALQPPAEVLASVDRILAGF